MIVSVKKYAILIAACSLIFASCATARDVPLELSSTVSAKPPVRSEPKIAAKATDATGATTAAVSAATAPLVAAAAGKVQGSSGVGL